jgi:thimet oligopeptidase
LKKEEKEKLNEEFDNKLHAFDFRYYLHMAESKKYDVDDQLVKQYFPLNKVTQGLLGTYQHLLGLRFVELLANNNVWHADVSTYEVYDAASSAFVGVFYLDLHPRPGKFGHAAVFGLQYACGFVDGADTGNVQHPVAAMVANFTKPTSDKPALLTHREVVTYYHEVNLPIFHFFILFMCLVM